MAACTVPLLLAVAPAGLAVWAGALVGGHLLRLASLHPGQDFDAYGVAGQASQSSLEQSLSSPSRSAPPFR